MSRPSVRIRHPALLTRLMLPPRIGPRIVVNRYYYVEPFQQVEYVSAGPARAGVHRLSEEGRMRLSTFARSRVIAVLAAVAIAAGLSATAAPASASHDGPKVWV